MTPQPYPNRAAIYAKLGQPQQAEPLPEQTVYPRYMYCRHSKQAKPKIVHDEQQEAALGPDWGYLPYADQIVPDVDSEPTTQPMARPGMADPGQTIGINQVLPPPPAPVQDQILTSGTLTAGSKPAQTPSAAPGTKGQ